MYFYIVGISAIIGGFFNLAGILAFISTLLFFYMMGRTHTKIEKRIL